MSRYDAEWTLEQGLEVVRALEPCLAEIGMHCGMLGSVLVKGKSLKDLDIVVYPHDTSSKVEFATIKDALTKAGLKRWISKLSVQTVWRKAGTQDTKHVELWLWNNKRVDLFFLQ